MKNDSNEKYIYVTFGQCHEHVVNGIKIGHDCIARVSGGRKEVFEIFGPWFCTTYKSLDQLSMKYYPRGVIEVKNNLLTKQQE